MEKEKRIPIEEAEAFAFSACIERLPHRKSSYEYSCQSCELQYIHNDWIYVVELSIIRRGGLFNSIKEVREGSVQIDAENGDVIGVRIKK